MTTTISSIVPTQLSEYLDDNTYDGYVVTLSIDGETQTRRVSSNQVFTYETQEDECALGGTSLISTVVDRLRSIAGL